MLITLNVWKEKNNMFNSYGASISGIFLLFATYCWHQLVLVFVFEELKKKSYNKKKPFSYWMCFRHLSFLKIQSLNVQLKCLWTMECHKGNFMIQIENLLRLWQVGKIMFKSNTHTEKNVYILYLLNVKNYVL